MPYVIIGAMSPIFQIHPPTFVIFISLLPAIKVMVLDKIFTLAIKHWLERVRFYLLPYIWPFFKCLKK
jgi:hypothetical protein